MCDYSAEAAKRRDAVVGDKLATSWISQHTMGLAEPASPDLAVCMLDGSRVKVTMNEAMSRDWHLPETPTALATFKKRELDPKKGESQRDGLVFDAAPAEHRLLMDFELGIQMTIESIPGETAADDHSRPAAAERVRELVDA